MQKRTVIVSIALVVVAIGWYLFRPERLWTNDTVNETFPTAETAGTTSAAGATPALVAGTFRGIAHETSGMAGLYDVGNGRRILRLSDFKTSNGPDVHVYLVAASDAGDNEMVTKAGFVDLGSLKGNIGDQNYDIPADVDVAKYHAVTIWCKRFSVNFGTAPLKAATAGL
jgi:hypothetical protein